MYKTGRKYKLARDIVNAAGETLSKFTTNWLGDGRYRMGMDIAEWARILRIVHMYNKTYYRWYLLPFVLKFTGDYSKELATCRVLWRNKKIYSQIKLKMLCLSRVLSSFTSHVCVKFTVINVMTINIFY